MSVAERFVRIVYRYAGATAEIGEIGGAGDAGASVQARRVPGYPPARGAAAWILEPAGDWDTLRSTAARLRRSEPDTPIFVEKVGRDDIARIERAGFRRRAARFSVLGVERYLVPERGPPPSVGELAKRAVAGLVPRSGLVVRGDRLGRAVHFTFDDGPHPEHTPRVLDALAAAGATATFFVVGASVEKHPDIVRRIVNEGHTLGHHSFTHAAPRRTSAQALLAEVHRTVELLRGIVGFAPRLFRPPRGQLTSGKLVRLWLARQKVVLWNVDPRDFACTSATDLAAALGEGQLGAGDIVLLHDDIPYLPPILPDLVRDLARSGLELRALTPY